MTFPINHLTVTRDYLPSRKKYESTAFLKHISSAASTHLPNFASVEGNPLKPHKTGSSNLIQLTKPINTFKTQTPMQETPNNGQKE